MALATNVNKNNPESLEISPDNFTESKNTQENIVTPENQENAPEKVNTEIKDKEKIDKVEAKVKEIVKPSSSAPQALSFHKRRALEIDKILSEGMHETFLALSPKKQQEFKLEGEKTVEKINKLLDKTKIKVDKIINLIKKWLKVIPGINQYFLEQEAKIKADKIINIKDKA
jgi:hypothetical protein